MKPHPGGERAGPVPFRKWRDLDHRVVRCSSLSYRSRVVLVALLTFANDAGLCWPSLPRLAREGGLSLATTKRALAELLGAAIVSRAGRSVFQLDLGRLMDVIAGEPIRLTREPMDRLNVELSIGSPVSRGEPPHPSLNFKKGTHSVESEPIVCAVDDLAGRILFVARAFALPLDTAQNPLVPAKMREGIAAALRSTTPAVLHRAVEMARAQPWRRSELGAWCFRDESFLALVRKAQDEQRHRARPRCRTPDETERPLSQKESVQAARNALRTLRAG